MTPVDRLRTALRRSPLLADLLLAAALLVLVLVARDPDRPGVGPPHTPPAVVLAVLTCGVLALRRRAPLPVLLASVTGAAASEVLVGGRTLLAAAPLLALYTVALRSERRTTWLAWAGTATALVAPGLLTAESALDPEVVSDLPWTGVAAAVGVALRNRRAYVSAVEERAARAEQTREEEARRRVAEERLHIARELHDVVAHRIAVVQVQAAVASHLLTREPEAAREALGHVRRAGSEILDELSGILNVLRSPGDAADPTAPSPGLGQLEALVASFAAAGLTVDWSLSGRPQDVGAAVDLVGYRVLEEALTNAHKHGTGTAEVVVDHTEQAVALRVVNPVRDHQPVATGGHGLLGMRERAAAVGGVLQAYPGADGRFHVEAVLPLHVPAAA